MDQYRKKPVVIEAAQFTEETRKDIINWIGEKNMVTTAIDDNGAEYTLLFPSIKTLEGEMKITHNDWIIKGVNGEFYPCKPDIFEKTYERV